MTLFRGCRYEVHKRAPGATASTLWSRHHSRREADRAYRSLMKNGVERGEAVAGTRVELLDIDGSTTVLARGVVGTGWTLPNWSAP